MTGITLFMSAIIGFVGAFISLALSKWSAKRAVACGFLAALATPKRAGYWNVRLGLLHQAYAGTRR